MTVLAMMRHSPSWSFDGSIFRPFMDTVEVFDINESREG